MVEGKPERRKNDQGLKVIDARGSILQTEPGNVGTWEPWKPMIFYGFHIFPLLVFPVS